MDTILSARNPVDHNRQGAAAGRGTLGPDELRKMHAYWRAANYVLGLSTKPRRP